MAAPLGVSPGSGRECGVRGASFALKVNSGACALTDLLRRVGFKGQDGEADRRGGVEVSDRAHALIPRTSASVCSLHACTARTRARPSPDVELTRDTFTSSPLVEFSNS